MPAWLVGLVQLEAMQQQQEEEVLSLVLQGSGVWVELQPTESQGQQRRGTDCFETETSEDLPLNQGERYYSQWEMPLLLVVPNQGKSQR